MKEHDYSIDIARGIACLLVIIGHISSTPSQVNVWIYAFHMPLFFIITQNAIVYHLKMKFLDDINTAFAVTRKLYIPKLSFK